MDKELKECVGAVKEYCKSAYKSCFREPKGKLKHPFIVPGSVYSSQLWDWDSWLTGLALFKIGREESFEYEKGSVLNFLEHIDGENRIPICVMSEDNDMFDLKKGVPTNIHKPCLAAHALSLIEEYGDFSWLEDKIENLEKYLSWYEQNCKHESGLYFWLNDFAIGVDNEPCTFYRPDKSSGSIYLNSLMYNELIAISKIEKLLKRKEKAKYYTELSESLKKAINAECYDERDGFYYTADLNLYPIDPDIWLHSGAPRTWTTLPMRIGVWSGFLPLWCKLASKKQAQRIVEEHYKNAKTFNSPFGVRSLSKMEKMYQINVSNNPSCWLGPIWIISNYMVFKGLLNYGYKIEARELAEKTVTLLGKDIIKCGEMHEYYDPETGRGVNNKGFQSWNLLSYEMALYLEKADR